MEQIESKLTAEFAQYDDDDDEDGALLVPINAEEAELFRSVFNTLDARKKVCAVKSLLSSNSRIRQGKLSADDLHTYIRNMSLRESSMSAEELNFYFALVEAADSSPDGSIDITGFALVASDHGEFFRAYAEHHKVGLALVRDPNRMSRLFKSTSRDSFTNIATRCSPKDLEDYRRVFDEFDEVF